eukprot:CAMPEP_0169140492 /NCGR_PEP_ID=MMETSP1015-20121227/43636_1 /TAXON_ID=342587 /ORGANISM="Karlodinium micrum, Strain CCMP2283" /LENGTH=218 /DNA_ID=CAMNT_0009206477 /DNA_START=18 /DNA_END=670 /DNA_ORIENTATION=-
MSLARDTVELDDASITRVLAFVNFPTARECCQEWSRQIFDALQLEHRIKFHRTVRQKGVVIYHHSAERAMGQDFEECVAYQFEFLPSKTYNLDWNRSFGQWSAANERQVGLDIGMSRTISFVAQVRRAPDTEEGYVRYAPPGRTFEIPVSVILSGSSITDHSSTPTWEYQVRGVPVPDNYLSCNATAPIQQSALVQVHSENARFVEIDGDFHEVSGDI